MFCNFDKIEENHCFFTGLPPKEVPLYNRYNDLINEELCYDDECGNV